MKSDRSFWWVASQYQTIFPPSISISARGDGSDDVLVWFALAPRARNPARSIPAAPAAPVLFQQLCRSHLSPRPTPPRPMSSGDPWDQKAAPRAAAAFRQAAWRRCQLWSRGFCPLRELTQPGAGWHRAVSGETRCRQHKGRPRARFYSSPFIIPDLIAPRCQARAWR